jgi:hypothetical protein
MEKGKQDGWEKLGWNDSPLGGYSNYRRWMQRDRAARGNVLKAEGRYVR